MDHGLLNVFFDAGAALFDGMFKPLAAFSELPYFVVIYKYLSHEITQFGEDVMGRVSVIVGAAALMLMTIWITFQGYRIVSGQSRDSLMGLMMNSLRATLIVIAAVTFGAGGSDIHSFLANDLKNSITEVITGDEDTTAENQIDKNLAVMQIAMSSIDVVKVVNDPATQERKSQLEWAAMLGTAGPAMAGASMLLLYSVALALFTGLGPIFILCLLFDQTKSLFSRWLLYGIGTMFSMAVLAAMVAIATKTVLAVAEVFWAQQLIGKLTGLDLGNGGLTSTALQQGGIGLLLTVLIISTPPMVASFFQGTLGQYYAQSMVGSGTLGASSQQSSRYDYNTNQRVDVPTDRSTPSGRGGNAPSSVENSRAVDPNHGRQPYQPDQVKPAGSTRKDVGEGS